MRPTPTSLPRFFVEATKENTEPLLQHNEILLMNVFSKERSAPFEAGRLIALTEKHIIYYKDTSKIKIKRIAKLDFDCKFEVLREEPKDSKTLGTPFGIKYERIGYQPVSLYNSNPQIINVWKEHLERLINQRGFHSLFKPIKKIGKGNFASVYLAERLEDHKLVAVKAFSKDATFSQEKGRESLINEINLMRKLNQENILKLHGIFESDNSIYMTMELLEGGQLFNKIQSKYRFTSEEVRKIMKGLLSGLKHMHSKRIMHRDLKPENIMLRSKNDNTDVVIVDFGLATWADEDHYLFVRCGTPGYVAPEIINIRDLNTKSDPICDVFSIGLIFHILLFGRSIFPGKTYNDVLTQNRACDFNLDAFEYTMLPQSTHHLLKMMLEKNPTKRISASDALEHPYFKEMQIQEMADIMQGVVGTLNNLGVNSTDSKFPNPQISMLRSMEDENNPPVPRMLQKVSILSPTSQKEQSVVFSPNPQSSILRNASNGPYMLNSSSMNKETAFGASRMGQFGSPFRSSWKENNRPS